MLLVTNYLISSLPIKQFLPFPQEKLPKQSSNLSIGLKVKYLMIISISNLKIYSFAPEIYILKRQVMHSPWHKHTQYTIVKQGKENGNKHTYVEERNDQNKNGIFFLQN